MEVSQKESVTDKLKNNFEDFLQVEKACDKTNEKSLDSIENGLFCDDEENSNINQKAIGEVNEDKLAVSDTIVFESSDATCNHGTKRTNISSDCERNIHETHIVTDTNIIFDSFQQVLLEYDEKIKSKENFASNLTEPSTMFGKGSEQIICVSSRNECSQAADLKQNATDGCDLKTVSLNNLATCNDEKKKTQRDTGLSETLNLNIDSQAIFTTITTELKKCEEREINDCRNIEINGLQQAVLKPVDQSGNNYASDIIELKTLKTSHQITHSKPNGCSLPTNFDLNKINDNKQENDDQSNLTVIDSIKNESQMEINMKVAEDSNMNVECSEVYAKEKQKCEVIPDLNGNSDSYIEENAMLLSEQCENTKVVEENKESVMKHLSYRDDSDSWSDDDDSSSTSSSDTSGSDFFQMVVESSSGQKNIPEIKTRGELGLDDLPPIEDLTITVPEEDMMLVGKIYAIVDKLVVVHAIKDLKPLDIDSVLFLSHDKPLGRVYDVFGPVVEPFYCIRFNNVQQINEKVTEMGADVFFAPEKDDITSYVFIDELAKVKGSDASWKDNNEPPEEYLDFSDDEQEKAARRKRMAKNRNERFSTSSDVSTKKPFLMRDPNFQQNSNSTPVTCPPRFSNINRSRTAFTSVSSVSATPNPYSSPSPVCSVFAAPQLSPYPTHPPPSPSPSVSSIFETPTFMLFSSPYPTHSPASPTPSLCSVMSVPTRARTPGSPNISTLKQPSSQFFNRPRLFSSQYVLPRPPLPLQNVMQRPPLPPPNLFQRTPPPPLPAYQQQQTHTFGQMTLMSPLPAFQPSLPPPASMPSFIPPTVSPTNYFHPGTPSRYMNPNVSSNPWLPNAFSHSHVPPHRPLTVQIPNLSSPIPINHLPPRNDTILPVVNNVIRNGQPPFY